MGAGEPLSFGDVQSPPLPSQQRIQGGGELFSFGGQPYWRDSSGRTWALTSAGTTGLGWSQTGFVNALGVPSMVFDGDSLTIGTGALPFNNFPFGNDYPSQVAGSLSHAGAFYNVGVGGETTATMIVNAPTVVDPKLAAGANNVVCFHGGTNDIYYGATDITTYSRIVTYCQARQAAGWQVIVATITPRSDAGTPVNQDTYRLSVNTMIRANWTTFASGIADIGGDANMGTLGAELNTQYYNGDKVHHNPNGYRVLAGYFLAALSALGVTGHQHEDRSGLVSDLWIPASQFGAISGSPTVGAISHVNTQQLHHGSVDVVTCPALIPQDWLTYAVQLIWTNTASASGNAYVYGEYLPVYSGSNAATAFTTSGNLVLTSPSAYIIQYTPMFTISNQAGDSPSRTLMNIAVVRNGSSGADTMTGDTIDMLGVYLYRVT
jgi:lysophospholipase L1-like esterase